MVLSTANPIQNYLSSPFTYLPLNREGKIVTKASAVVEISYKELKTANSKIESIAYKVMDYFRSSPVGCCSRCRYRSFTVIKEIDLNPLNSDIDLEQKIRTLQANHPLDFRSKILSRNETISPEPIFPYPLRDLTKELQSFLMERITPEPMYTKQVLQALTLAVRGREIALKALEFSKGSIVYIPSNSDFFREINRPQNSKYSKIRPTSESSKIRSLVSVRVFPNGSSSITIPHLQRASGGMKILNPEIHIAPDETFTLMRRIKLRERVRERFGQRSIEIMLKVAECTYPGILTPKCLYLHPKKGLEYLVEECKEDLFNLLSPYTLLQRKSIGFEDPAARDILHSPIESQIHTYLELMKRIALALLYMHQQKLLHNDIKPENILINNEKKPQLSDFDFTCTEQEGLSLHLFAGTKFYVDTNCRYRNFATDLFALARTFWMEIPLSLENKPPSFMDVFLVLYTLSRTKKPKLTPHIESLILSIRKLCKSMREGITGPDGITFPSLDTIIAKIEELDQKFDP